MTADKILIDIKCLKKSLTRAIQFPNKKNYTIHYLNVDLEGNVLPFIIGEGCSKWVNKRG